MWLSLLYPSSALQVSFSMKAYMQPCSLERKLKLFPKLARSKLSTKLGPNSALWKQLPEEFKQVQHPCLWQAGTQLTLMVIATVCLTTLFLSLRYEAKRVGYWMVKASPEQRQQLRAGQRAAGYHSSTDCCAWWEKSMQAEYSGMSQAARDKLDEQAALALFLNPPVSSFGDVGSKHACMCLRTGTASGRHIEWHKGYPYLVLQHACVGDDGTAFPKLRVAVHQLVALFFLGPRSGQTGQVVCHHDVPPTVLKVEWESAEHVGPNIMRCLPATSRCVSQGCVCPVCVHYDTQSNNAKTGKQRQQLVDRKSRQKK